MNSRSVITLVCAVVVLGVTPSAGSGTSSIVQTNWKIVSAGGTTVFKVRGSRNQSSYQANLVVQWVQTAQNRNRPGWHVASFNFKSMARYVPGQSAPQRDPIHDVSATVSGQASYSDPSSGSHSCQLRGPVKRDFFSGSAVNDLFLDSTKSDTKLFAHVEGQSPAANVIGPTCAGVTIPQTYDVKRETIGPIPLSLLKKTKPGTKVSLVLFRQVPVVEGTQTVGQVTEKAKITLKLVSGL